MRSVLVGLGILLLSATSILADITISPCENPTANSFVAADGATVLVYKTLPVVPSGPAFYTYIVQATTFTSTAQTVSICSFDVPVSSDSYWVGGTVVAKCKSGTDRGKTGRYTFAATVVNKDGVVSEPSGEVVSSNFEVSASCDVTVTVSGSKGFVNVTGVNGDNITWGTNLIINYMRE